MHLLPFVFLSRGPYPVVVFYGFVVVLPCDGYPNLKSWVPKISEAKINSYTFELFSFLVRVIFGDELINISVVRVIVYWKVR